MICSSSSSSRALIYGSRRWFCDGKGKKDGESSSSSKGEDKMSFMTFLVGGFVCMGILSGKRVMERKTGKDYSFMSIFSGNFGMPKRKFTERGDKN